MHARVLWVTDARNQKGRFDRDARNELLGNGYAMRATYIKEDTAGNPSDLQAKLTSVN